ncbi:MAG TPA: amino acid adenylation domain-containing protein [Terriglobales bacterium]|nr:amino acid adenylation domain-containing protein [Terriglobales bacterium]
MTRLLQNWVSAQAERRPEAVAVVMERQALTYRQLEEASNRLARLLKAAGCRRGDRVCFAIPKSPAAIIAILGILKADCIHVPIDTSSPTHRVSKLLKSSEPRYLLGVGASASLLQDLFSQNNFKSSIRVGWMEESSQQFPTFTPAFTWSDVDSYSSEPLEYENNSDDPAHILFTSGSTGEPKGVVITHANVIHFVDWATRYFGMTDSDHVSCHPPLHFDLATFDIFGAFAAGAQLYLVLPELSLLPNKLAEYMRNAELTQWFSVPSVLSYMAKFDVVEFNDFPALKRLLWCGEVFPTPALAYWMKRLPKVTFTNLYGPTETTIASSYYTVPNCPLDDNQPIPIGTACNGEELLVLDHKLCPMPPGEVGDLYIGGVGLSPGYWRNPAQTTSAFVVAGAGHRIYRTGDLARRGEDDLVYFVGRTDSQIKSRGYRIELGEIEVALNAVKELKESAVVAIPTDGFENNLICCAYVAQDKLQISASEIRRSLSAVLPAYMLPSRWMNLRELPKNPNGKIDRRKIQDSFAVEITTTQNPLPADSDLSVRGAGSQIADLGEPTDSADQRSLSRLVLSRSRVR